MQVKSYPIESLHSFSKLLIGYLAEFPALAQFYGNSPKLEEFEKQIAEKKSFSYSNRAVLHEVIKGQYHEIGQEWGLILYWIKIRIRLLRGTN